MSTAMSSVQFLPPQIMQQSGNVLSQTGGAFDTDQNTGAEYQHWSGQSQLTSAQEGIISSAGRFMSLPNPSGKPGGIPMPVSKAVHGSMAFTMEQ